MKTVYTIGTETADQIALSVLKEHREYLKKELDDHKNGEWLHPEDVPKNCALIEAMDFIIDYFGG
jgi:hypothetical protein